MSHRTYLCFDHGEKRIGVAVGQSVTNTARPLEIIAAVNGKPDWERITSLVNQWSPDDIVVGHPLTMKGQRQPATDAAERFSRQMHGRYLLPVHLCDERLSSKEAQTRLQDTYNIDAVAAQLILETWMLGHTNSEANDTIPPELKSGESQ